MTEPDVDVAAAVAETIEFLQVRRAGHGWIGDAPDWWGERLFGGFVLGQAVSAATRDAPPGRRLVSLHGYFLRPMLAGRPVTYRISTLREGRSFTIRALEATQDDRPLFAMQCSFGADADGYDYELAAHDAPGPEGFPIQTGPGPWLEVDLGPTGPEPDGTYRSTSRAWFRIGAELPDDEHLHAALVAFATDMTKTGARPERLDGPIDGIVSLDHAVWFHRPVRADEWLLYDVQSQVNTAGRGLLRGTMRTSDRRLAVSVAQETLLRP
jgi:acyl-CoA thioesterase II